MEGLSVRLDGVWFHSVRTEWNRGLALSFTTKTDEQRRQMRTLLNKCLAQEEAEFTAGGRTVRAAMRQVGCSDDSDELQGIDLLGEYFRLGDLGEVWARHDMPKNCIVVLCLPHEECNAFL